MAKGHVTGTREEWRQLRLELLELAELFDGRSQLLVYHFMFGPDWDAGCEGCSLVADHFDGGMVHLNQRDVTIDFGVSFTDEQRANGGEYNFRWEDDPGEEGRGLSSFALDRAPKGRDEEALLRGEGEWWWRRHDEYGET